MSPRWTGRIDLLEAVSLGRAITSFVQAFNPCSVGPVTPGPDFWRAPVYVAHSSLRLLARDAQGSAQASCFAPGPVRSYGIGREDMSSIRRMAPGNGGM